MTEEQAQTIEIQLLLEGIFQVYGYDFRGYAEASLRRRLTLWLARSGFASFSQAQAELLRNPARFEGLLQGITVNVSEMFRDPAFFRALRERVVPHLLTYPFVKVWLAGCASGEEAYSMAILLEEEGLGDRTRIYATDIDPAVLQRAGQGVYALKEMQRFTQNYQQAGGKAAFSDYYTTRTEHAVLRPSLKQRIVFASHNLAADVAFGEMHLILCRNVMIYFKSALKERVLDLFQACLVPGGFLCLGVKESLQGQPRAPQFEEVLPRLSIYRKRYV